jgi:hypothetical protein
VDCRSGSQEWTSYSTKTNNNTQEYEKEGKRATQDIDPTDRTIAGVADQKSTGDNRRNKSMSRYQQQHRELHVEPGRQPRVEHGRQPEGTNNIECSDHSDIEMQEWIAGLQEWVQQTREVNSGVDEARVVPTKRNKQEESTEVSTRHESAYQQHRRLHGESGDNRRNEHRRGMHEMTPAEARLSHHIVVETFVEGP